MPTHAAVDDAGAVYVVPYYAANGAVVRTIYFNRESAPPDAVRVDNMKNIRTEVPHASEQDVLADAAR